MCKKFLPFRLFCMMMMSTKYYFASIKYDWKDTNATYAEKNILTNVMNYYNWVEFMNHFDLLSFAYCD